MKFNILCIGIALCTNSAFAQDHSHHSQHNHTQYAPVGVMGEHGHEVGKFMVSYRYSTMSMKGNRSGTNDLSPTEVRNRYTMAPLDMSMQMHMLSAMYGVSENLTIMAMVPYVDKSMDMLGMAGALSTMDSDGISDVKLTGVYALPKHGNHQFHIKMGVSLPTGSTDERGANGLKLPYPMQLGSGTYDLLPGVSYTNRVGKVILGGQMHATIRLGENNDDYSLGDEYAASVWTGYQVADAVDVTLRFEGKTLGNIDGEDAELAGRATMNMSPLFKTNLRGGERVDASIGAGYTFQNGSIAGHRFAVEVGMPVYENFDGPQLSQQYKLMVGYQAAF